MKSSHFSTIPDALWAMHHHVDIGVGPSTADVSCHNLDVVHNTWRVELHVGPSHTLPLSHYGSWHRSWAGTGSAVNQGLMITEWGSRSNILPTKFSLIQWVCFLSKLREIWRSGACQIVFNQMLHLPVGWLPPTKMSLWIFPSSSSTANQRLMGNSYTILFPRSSKITWKEYDNNLTTNWWFCTKF